MNIEDGCINEEHESCDSCCSCLTCLDNLLRDNEEKISDLNNQLQVERDAVLHLKSKLTIADELLVKALNKIIKLEETPANSIPKERVEALVKNLREFITFQECSTWRTNMLNEIKDILSNQPINQGVNDA